MSNSLLIAKGAFVALEQMTDAINRIEKIVCSKELNKEQSDAAYDVLAILFDARHWVRAISYTDNDVEDGE